jgi:hypothetical protein
MPYEMFGTALWCGAGSVSDPGLDKIACLPRLRSLTLSAPHRYAVMWKGKSPNKGFQQS